MPHSPDRRRHLALAGALLAGLLWVGSGRADAAPAAPARATQGDVCSSAWLARSAGSAAPAMVAASGVPIGSLDAATSAAAHRPDRASDVHQPTGRYPNDTYFRLYQRNTLMQMGALDAWETSHGGGDVVIAVVSTGVAHTHPDLADKMWRNPGEVPDNGIDDDGNGYVDDVVGWSFPDRSSDPQDIPRGRGTMMAGIAAAESNNEEGIAGVSWGARIMALRTLVPQDDPSRPFIGTVEDQVEAVCYAANNGAGVLLFGGYLQDPDAVGDAVERLRQAVDYAHTQGVIVIAPAGDCGLPQEFCPPEDPYLRNPDIVPATFGHVIGVQSVTVHLTAREEASSGRWVDISAPGEEFMTTSADPPYSYVRHQRATSDYGAAHVAGVAAVLRTINPNLTPYQVEQALCETATRPRGVEFEYPPSGPPRNDTWGCGLVDFEAAVESVPPVVRARLQAPIGLGSDTPRTEIRQTTDGSRPWPILRFENPYLSASAWHLVADAAWVGEAVEEDLADGSSTGEVATNLDVLREEHGPILSGSVYTSEIRACATDWGPAASPCQSFTYRLTVVDRLERIYLPFAFD